MRRHHPAQRPVRFGLTMSVRQNTMIEKWTRMGLAAASGLALAAAFPKFDLNLFAWVAFIPLFFVIERQPLSRVFGYSWLQGFVCFAGSLYWIVTTLHN